MSRLSQQQLLSCFSGLCNAAELAKLEHLKGTWELLGWLVLRSTSASCAKGKDLECGFWRRQQIPSSYHSTERPLTATQLCTFRDLNDGSLEVRLRLNLLLYILRPRSKLEGGLGNIPLLFLKELLHGRRNEWAFLASHHHLGMITIRSFSRISSCFAENQVKLCGTATLFLKFSNLKELQSKICSIFGWNLSLTSNVEKMANFIDNLDEDPGKWVLQQATADTWYTDPKDVYMKALQWEGNA